MRKIARKARETWHGVSAILRTPSHARCQYQMLDKQIYRDGGAGPIKEADSVRKIASDAVPNYNASRGDFAHPTIFMTSRLRSILVVHAFAAPTR